MKLGLGTVQFGMNYGISNTFGQTKLDGVNKILNAASNNRIKLLDTASLYGQSEEVLGKILKRSHPFKIITKTPHFNTPNITANDVQNLRKTFEGSLFKLKQTSIYGLLMHNAEDILANRGYLLYEEMVNLKQKGLVHKIGVSVYNSIQIDKIIEQYNFDIIQLPVNVLDQRLLLSGHLVKIKQVGVEIHARSVFLQGLLLMPLDKIPSYFSPVFNLLTKYHQDLKLRNITPLESALNFIKHLKEIDYIIIGVNNEKQLLDNVEAYRKDFGIDYSLYSCENINIINPSKWCIK